jgi:hypothetical protein
LVRWCVATSAAECPLWPAKIQVEPPRKERSNAISMQRFSSQALSVLNLCSLDPLPAGPKVPSDIALSHSSK